MIRACVSVCCFSPLPAPLCPFGLCRLFKRPLCSRLKLSKELREWNKNEAIGETYLYTMH
jgi:hypothetical protein